LTVIDNRNRTSTVNLSVSYWAVISSENHGVLVAADGQKDVVLAAYLNQIGFIANDKGATPNQAVVETGVEALVDDAICLYSPNTAHPLCDEFLTPCAFNMGLNKQLNGMSDEDATQAIQAGDFEAFDYIEVRVIVAGTRRAGDGVCLCNRRLHSRPSGPKPCPKTMEHHDARSRARRRNRIFHEPGHHDLHLFGDAPAGLDFNTPPARLAGFLVLRVVHQTFVWTPMSHGSAASNI
jgi:hypothetical protein